MELEKHTILSNICDETIRTKMLALFFKYSELTATDIQRTLDFPYYSKINRHLMYMMRFGILNTRKEGVNAIHYIKEDDIEDVKYFLIPVMKDPEILELFQAYQRLLKEGKINTWS